MSTVLAKTIHFCWIPSHVGIKGNDLADQAAKDATNDDPSSLPVPYTDRRRHINSFVRSKWQTLWDVAVNSKLQAIQPSMGCWPGSRRKARREEVVFARMELLGVTWPYVPLLRKWLQYDAAAFGSLLFGKPRQGRIQA